VPRQADGNFVLSNASGSAAWSTRTGGQPLDAGSSLSGGGTLWPNYYLLSPDTRFVLIQQSDGNLMLYDSHNNVLWQANEPGHTNAYTALQTDGNQVEYSSTNFPLWYTATNSATHANMQSDGNFVRSVQRCVGARLTDQHRPAANKPGAKFPRLLDCGDAAGRRSPRRGLRPRSGPCHPWR